MQTPQHQRPLTRTEWVDEQLRESILCGRRRPGEKLVLSSLATELGISASPIREALARLTMHGLIDLTPHGTATVAGISVGEAIDVYQLRCLIEPRALAAAISAATDVDRQRWVEAFDLLGSGPEPIDNLRHHARFHRTLVSSCPSRWTLRIVIPLQDNALRIVAATSRQLPNDYDVARDHRRLLELALAGDAEGAAAELTEHLARTVHVLRDD